MSHGRPYKCVGTTARVRGVIARSNAAGSRLNVTGSTSAKTGCESSDARELRNDPEGQRGQDDLRVRQESPAP